MYVSLNSFTKCLIVGVEHFGFMMYFRVILYCNGVFIRLPWSVVGLLDSDILVFFGWACLGTDHVLRSIKLP